MQATVCVGANVCSIERWQHFSFRDGALSTICFSNRNPKRALAKPGCYQSRMTVPCGGLSELSSCCSVYAPRNVLKLIPQTETFNFVR